MSEFMRAKILNKMKARSEMISLGKQTPGFETTYSIIIRPPVYVLL